MSTSSDISLGSLRIQAKQRSDLENNNSVSDPEWNGYITNSRKRLYNLLVGAYGNDYYFAVNYPFTLGSTQFIPLPDGTPSFTDANGGIAKKFYKLLGVDLQCSASPSGYVNVKRIEFIERNKYAYPNTATNWNGYTNLKYRLEGDNLFLVPLPMTGQTGRIWYAPAPTSLQFMLPGYSVAASNVVGSMSDTTGVTVGMNCFSFTPGVLPTNTTVTSVSTTTMTLSNNANATLNANIFAMWSDATSVDAIAGWEEFVIVDAAIKAQIKQEGPTQELMMQRQDMLAEIEGLGERDAGEAQHVSDAMATSPGGYGDGYGFGEGW